MANEPRMGWCVVCNKRQPALDNGNCQECFNHLYKDEPADVSVTRNGITMGWDAPMEYDHD